MSEKYVSSQCIVLKEISAFRGQKDSDDFFEDISEIPDTKTAQFEFRVRIGETFTGPNTYEEYWISVVTGDLWEGWPYLWGDETEVRGGLIYMASFNWRRAKKAIEDLIARCDNGTLYSSMPKLVMHFEYNDYYFGPDE
ncbi:MAG: hypothetical protein ABJN26_25325 [Stappiaceae bacterium]